MPANLMHCADFWVGPPLIRPARPSWLRRVAASTIPINLMRCADFWVGPPLRLPLCPPLGPGGR
jgi:hypothetical protein